jgi:hypothetical protein
MFFMKAFSSTYPHIPPLSWFPLEKTSTTTISQKGMVETGTDEQLAVVVEEVQEVVVVVVETGTDEQTHAHAHTTTRILTRELMTSVDRLSHGPPSHHSL